MRYKRLIKMTPKFGEIYDMELPDRHRRKISMYIRNLEMDLKRFSVLSDKLLAFTVVTAPQLRDQG